MKVSSINLVAVLLVGSVVVAACGGSGDDGAGSLTSFSVTPDTVKVKYSGAACPADDAALVLVNGGTAPYDLFGPGGVIFQSVNPATKVPTGIAITRLANENTQFAIITDGTTCYGDAAISVKDRHGREAVMRLTTAASGTT